MREILVKCDRDKKNPNKTGVKNDESAGEHYEFFAR
jgi:hypothetical protein